MLATYSPATDLEELYSSSSMHPFGQQGRYHQLQQHDAQSIVLHTATPGSYPHYPISHGPAESPEEIQRRAIFAQRRAWMKRVAEWIAQTEMTGNYKPQRLDSIPEIMEEPQTSCEEVLYVASPPPSPSVPLYPFANSAGTLHTSSSSSASSSGISAKSLKRSSHGRASSLESISEEVEE